MMTFVLLAGLMIAAALAVLVLPLLRSARTSPVDPAAARLRALEQAHAAGVIDADEYAAKRAALASGVASTAPPATTAAPSRATFAALLVVAVMLPASALLLYRAVGSPEALDPANLVAAATEAPAHADRGPEMEQAIATLATRLKEHPDDVEGWALLGRAYQAMGKYPESLDALKHARTLAPDNAAITVEYAQAVAMQSPQHRIDGEARELLEGALKSDPQNQRALWLLGISDFQANRFDAAIARWNTLLPLLPPDSEVAKSVQNQIADATAKRDGKEPPPRDVATETATAAPTPPSATGAAPAAGAPKLTVNVSLDPKLKSQFDPDATLFVFARASKGPPMPLAIQRLKASQLPITITLDDSTSMLPTMKLSTFPQVVVGARLSKSGNAIAQTGDLQTLTAPIDSHRSEPLNLVIDQVAP